MTAAEFLAEKAAKTDRALKAYFATWDGVPEALREAIDYCVFAAGKRLRPALALGAAEIVASDDSVAMPAACAIEMIHTYSLVHDDLPAMDDDDLRRGKPSVHKAFGESIAILTGDALLTMAFDVAAQSDNAVVVREIAHAAGVSGMVAGQVLDLEGETKRLTVEQLRRIHSCKTGALIRASVRCGAILASAEPTQLDAITRFGEHVGLAFQIADDILNVVGTERALGKPVGSDEANHKTTYPSLVGLDRARQLAEDTVAQAVEALAPFGPEADVFRVLARFIIERQT